MTAACVVASPIRLRSPTDVPGPNARLSQFSDRVGGDGDSCHGAQRRIQSPHALFAPGNDLVSCDLRQLATFVRRECA